MQKVSEYQSVVVVDVVVGAVFPRTSSGVPMPKIPPSFPMNMFRSDFMLLLATFLLLGACFTKRAPWKEDADAVSRPSELGANAATAFWEDPTSKIKLHTRVARRVVGCDDTSTRMF
jgi:hypothetical protein